MCFFSHRFVRTMENIPFDLVLMEIFFRLPLKSVGRFRTVCKDWYEALRNFEFLMKHSACVSDRLDELLEEGLYPDPYLI
ncbi:putative F-box domain-containing protein [Helianthus anomalus]